MTDQPPLPRRRSDSGPWLCSAAAGCDAVAVLQYAVPDPSTSDPGDTVPVFACADHAPDPT